MLNPDGVYLGNYRPIKKGISGCHLVSARLHCRSIGAEAATDPSAMKVSLEFYIDVHAHSTMMNGFMYGNVFEEEERVQRQAVFPRLLCHNAPDFSFSSTSFNRDVVKAGTGRRFLGGLLDDTSYCYTLEVSFYSYLTAGSTTPIPYTEDSCTYFGHIMHMSPNHRSHRKEPKLPCLKERSTKSRDRLLGISPKVEFSTTSVIEECDVKISQPAVSPPKTLPFKTCPVSPRKPKQTATEPCGYQRPTIASQSRCLSPYTHRRMCQLTDDAKQRLRHLQLGPYTFKKDMACQPPFVMTGHSQSVCPVSPGGKSTSFLGTLSPRRNQAYQSTLVSSSLREQSPLLSSTTLRERFQSPSSPSQDIHRRVQKLLFTLSTPRKLTFEEEENEEGESDQNEPAPSCHDSVHHSQYHEDRIIPGAPSVHLDNGTFWTNKAAKYTGKSHRAVFEDSLGKIYKNLYRKASSPTHCDSHSN
ncbi:Cytosolic carboxypeptidase 6 [Bagarius yarrelli]|uniref:Cytosolic carboxypeptidase 6 n=1 Tax=Bagarius yarrelli TaxID=175774 RepID=A0A556U7V5_BAGYA|nr:Cytosolic carboxypeptidase 6 [Bagarius yarrelli]